MCDTKARWFHSKPWWNSEIPLPKWRSNRYWLTTFPVWLYDAKWQMKNPTEALKSTFAWHPPRMPPSVSLRCNNRQECFATFQNEKATPQGNKIRTSEDPRVFSSTWASRSGIIFGKSWIFEISWKFIFEPWKSTSDHSEFECRCLEPSQNEW